MKRMDDKKRNWLQTAQSRPEVGAPIAPALPRLGAQEGMHEKSLTNGLPGKPTCHSPQKLVHLRADFCDALADQGFAHENRAGAAAGQTLDVIAGVDAALGDEQG